MIQLLNLREWFSSPCLYRTAVVVRTGVLDSHLGPNPEFTIYSAVWRDFSEPQFLIYVMGIVMVPDEGA